MKPMLACKVKGTLTFPLYASPKIDGVRVLIKDGVALSRKLLPIPNRYVQSVLSHPLMEGMDGEIVSGDPTAKNCFQATLSAVMSEDGEPNFKFLVFDLWNSARGFKWRCMELHDRCKDPVVKKLPVLRLSQLEMRSQKELDDYEASMVGRGYEGLIVRSPLSRYKFGRSTENEQALMKIKRFDDSEARVIDVQELKQNNNVATRDELGNTKRSSHAANKQNMGTLGALVVRDVGTGIQFNVGTGFSAEQRSLFWRNRADLIGKLVKYKFFAVGVKIAPRHPVFLGFRHEIDI